MNALLALRPAKPLGVHFRHPCLACPSRCIDPLHHHNPRKKTIIPRSAQCPCLFMNALLALRPAKPLGVHFRHPCLACPSRCTNSHHSYSLLKRTSVPRLTPTSLPPLSKVRCCRPKKFGRLPEGLPHQTSPSPQPSQNTCQPFAPRHHPCLLISALPVSHPHHPSPHTNILASLVKGEVLSPEKIRATTGGIATPNLTIPTTLTKYLPTLCPAPTPLPPLEKGEVA